MREARRQAQSAHSLVMSGGAEAGPLSARALATAERLDDVAALRDALRARQLARSDADGNAERLVLGGRMLALAARTGDATDALWGHLWRVDALLQAGRVAAAEDDRRRGYRATVTTSTGPPDGAATTAITSAYVVLARQPDGRWLVVADSPDLLEVDD